VIEVVANATVVLGIAGIGGTLLAAVVAGATSLWVEKIKGRRESAAMRVTARSGARLVLKELIEHGAKWEALTYYRNDLPRNLDLTSSPMWDRYTEVLSGTLTFGEFAEVAEAYARIERQGREYEQEYAGGASPASEDFVAWIKDTPRMIQKAQSALRRLAAD
jgi:hypothetical protein